MFQSRKVGDILVLVAPGELDARNAQAAKEHLKELVKAGNSRMVIDLSPLTFIDSSGLGALLTALKAARTANGDVKLTGLTPPVRTIFELTRLYNVFSSYPTVELAAQSF